MTTATLIVGTLGRERQTQAPPGTEDAGLSGTKNRLGREKVATTMAVPTFA